MKNDKNYYQEIIEMNNTTYILIGFWQDLYGYYVKSDDGGNYIYKCKRYTRDFVNTGIQFDKDTVTNFSTKLRGCLL